MILKSFKYRLYPNAEQRRIIETTINSCRFIYNISLNERNETYKRLKDDKEALRSYKYKTIKQLKSEFQFLDGVDAQALRQAQMNLELAFQRFFKKKCKYPNFKSKYKSKKSYRTMNVNNFTSIRFDTNEDSSHNFSKIKLPKLGFIKCSGYNPKQNFKIKSATIVADNDKYYCQLLCEVPSVQRDINTDRSSIGIDIGIEKFITCSDGTIIDTVNIKNKPIKILKELKRRQNKVKKLQKKLSRKKKNSNRRLKTKKKLNTQFKKNNDFQSQLFYKIIDKICSENQTITIENLNLKGMMKRKAGKRFRFAKSLQLLSISKFYSILHQKSVEYSTEIVEADRFYPSSKLCSNCGAKNADLSISDSIYNCPSCEASIDRDLNASINLSLYTNNTAQAVSAKAVEYSHGEIFSQTVAMQQFAVSLK